jgi:hypothetical protein
MLATCVAPGSKNCTPGFAQTSVDNTRAGHGSRPRSVERLAPKVVEVRSLGALVRLERYACSDGKLRLAQANVAHAVSNSPHRDAADDRLLVNSAPTRRAHCRVRPVPGRVGCGRRRSSSWTCRVRTAGWRGGRTTSTIPSGAGRCRTPTDLPRPTECAPSSARPFVLDD